MALKSKWIKGLAADEPFSRAAELALGQRLPIVWHYLPLAAEHSEDNVEYVHQLRVTTRRAAAAIEVFADALPKRRTAWMTHRLKQIRRAAGEARDMDVLARRFADDSAYKSLLDEIRRRRDEAQEPIAKVHKKLAAKDLAARIGKLLARIRWRGEASEPTFAKAAPRILKPIAKKFFKQSLADLTDMEQLHRLRKDGKQLRYAMELLAAAFDDSFRSDLYVEIEEVQTKLGKVNDHLVARKYIDAFASSAASHPSVGMFADFAAAEHEDMLIAADAFRAWFDAERMKELEAAFAKI